MGQIVIGDGQQPTRLQELVMNLHRSDQEENVRRIAAVVADLVREGVAGEGVAVALREADVRVAGAEAVAQQLRAALEVAGQLSADQQKHIADLEATIAEVNATVDRLQAETPSNTAPAPDETPQP